MAQTFSIKQALVRVAVLFSLLITAHAAEAAQVKAFVSIPPQKYFVEKIGANLVDVAVMVAPGSDPHSYEPKPRQMSGLAEAAVYFAVGIDFEKAWLSKIAATNPRMRIVRTDAGIAKIAIAGRHHGHAQGRETDAPDPHVWLAPHLVKVQAQHITDALVTVDPDNRVRYEQNCAAFLHEIEALHTELAALFTASQGTRFMVFHPSWGYFAQAYGLEQVPIEIEGKDPKPAQLKDLIQHAKMRGIQVVFAQPQFSAKIAEMVAREVGGQVIHADPLAANWAENLREVARRFKAALR